MAITRTGDFKTGGNNQTDARSVNNFDPNKSDNSQLQQMREKIGAGFSADKMRQTGKKRNEMGKDDFMKLMSAQLKYQDPMSPMKNEAMAAQLAQFSSLEQMLNVNQNLEKMTAGQKPSEHMMAASLIGKRVTTDTSHFMLEKDGNPEITFDLPEDATGVNVAVVSAKGEVVREFDLGNMQKGAQSVRWDGKNAKSQAEPLGEYSYKISARDKDGKPLSLESSTKGLVSGVTFEGGKTMLLVDGKKIALEQVGQIEMADTSQAAASTAIPAGAKAASALNPQGTAPVAPQLAANAANSLAPPDKQNLSTNKNSSTQPAKNNLPQSISPEKINAMLAALKQKAASEAAGSEEASEPAVNQQPAMPLWNPESNQE